MRTRVALLALGSVLMLIVQSPAQSPSMQYTALYVFGASFSDTSHGPYWQGRWSNGPMWPEFLSTNLGFVYKVQNNLAVGGHTSSQILGQVRAFTVPANAASAVFSLELGYNDLTTAAVNNAQIWTNTIRNTVLNWSNSVVACYEKGARAILAFNFVDLNFFPAKASAISDPNAVRNQTIVANAMLRTARHALGARYPELRLITIDHFAAADLLATSYASYGFTRIDIGALNDPALPDKSFTGPGGSYFFWDGGHVTSKAHALFADVLFAAVQGPRLSLAPAVGGLQLTIQPLQLGRTYNVEESSDLLRWTRGSPYLAAQPISELLVPTALRAGYFRLSSED